MKAIVVCNGSIQDYSYYKKYFAQAELIICADGGATHLKKFGFNPHILLGDFDSICEEDYNYFCNQGVEIIKFPAEKDMTDTELALEIAADRGCASILIIGGLGTRMDHSLSNIFLLKKMLDRGISCTIINELNEITLIDGSTDVENDSNSRLTLLALTDTAEGVTTEGLYYPLKDACIPLGSTWGVSNEFTEKKARVTIRKGLMLVIKSRDN